jgi:hypothetical protein
MMLQGGSMDLYMVHNVSGTLIEQLWFDQLCCGSWNTKRQMVWCRRLQRLGYGFGRAKPRDLFNFWRRKLFFKTVFILADQMVHILQLFHGIPSQRIHAFFI